MIATYTLKENELDIRFVNSIKEMFKGKPVSITISDVIDDTEYLLVNQANREHLMSNAISSELKTFRGNEFDTIVEQLSK